MARPDPALSSERDEGSSRDARMAGQEKEGDAYPITLPPGKKAIFDYAPISRMSYRALRGNVHLQCPCRPAQCIPIPHYLHTHTLTIAGTPWTSVTTNN